LSPAAQRQIIVALAVIEHVNDQLVTLNRDLKAFARAQPGCRALMRHYGIGPQVACAILAELGDTRRFSSSRRSVRFAGLDVTVHESDTKRRAGHLSRQARRCCAGPRSKPPNQRASPPRPITPITSSSSSASARTAPCSRSRDSCCGARTTPSVSLGDQALVPVA
jgi:hypothetical protein